MFELILTDVVRVNLAIFCHTNGGLKIGIEFLLHYMLKRRIGMLGDKLLVVGDAKGK
jgi:hypothetical protein